MDRELAMQIEFSKHNLSTKQIDTIFHNVERKVLHFALSEARLEQELLDHNFGDINRNFLPISDEEVNAARRRLHLDLLYSFISKRIEKQLKRTKCEIKIENIKMESI